MFLTLLGPLFPVVQWLLQKKKERENQCKKMVLLQMFQDQLGTKYGIFEVFFLICRK